MAIVDNPPRGTPFGTASFKREWPPSVESVLDHLQREDVHRFLDARHRIKQATRSELVAQGFTEIDTPVAGPLVREYSMTPPSAALLPDGRALWLNQSPQLYKQLSTQLVTDRCFQFAHCFRWEALDPDRSDQLRGLLQLDLEMRATEPSQVIEIVEIVVAAAAEEMGVGCARPFPRITYAESIERYGTDAPTTEADGGAIAPLWVTDFPLLDAPAGAGGHPVPLRHVMALPEREPGGQDDSAIRTRSYDLIIGGSEVAGGALRISDRALQERVLDYFGNDHDD